MPIVNYVREHIRFMEYATDEHLTGSERLLWYALMHIMNQRAQGNVWPDEFIRVSNDRLLSYCPMKFDTMANARNSLKQRGLIEFTKGEKNKLSPAYRMIYFYPQYAAPDTERDGESYPKNSDNMGGNTGYNTGGNMGYNTGGNMGDISINNTDIDTVLQGKPGEIHTRLNDSCKYAHVSRAREGWYINPDGKKRPSRFDSAWKTSPKARGAVAQRVIDGLPFPLEPGILLHEKLVHLMEYGMPPELMEDTARIASGLTNFQVLLDMLAEKREYTEEANEWRRCLKIANGNEKFAKMLFAQHKRSQEEKVE